MMKSESRIVSPKKSLNGTMFVPGDKSLSHRAVMFGSIAKGTTKIEGFLDGEDCRATIACFRELGVSILQEGETVTVHGKGMRELTPPKKPLDVGNSGTTIRLMSGILAAQPFETTISGDASIEARPMGRVIEPLRQMGANIQTKNNAGLAPLRIVGAPLTGIDYKLPVASAQVKSAILLASLYAENETNIAEPIASRDHTEIMLNYFGANIHKKQGIITSRPVGELYAKPFLIPGDISSAAFFMVAGLIVPNSHIIITNVGINPTRTGIVSALREMGGHVEVVNRRMLCGEWIGDIEVKSSALVGTTLQGNIIPRMIDEIPVLAVAALFATGKTVIKDATELKVKESNRIRTMAEELGKMGAVIEETEDGMVIDGGQQLKGAKVCTHNDHRVAMSLAIAALVAQGETQIEDSNIVDVSFPGFYEQLNNL